MDLSAPPAADPLKLALERELHGNERVLWSGKQLARVSWGGLAIWLFAVPWTAFAVFWTVMAKPGTARVSCGSTSAARATATAMSARLLSWSVPSPTG